MVQRRDARPVILPTHGSVIYPPRLPLSENDLKECSGLRDFVIQNPECLPVAQINPNYYPLIPVGVEIETNSGPIDCLFVAPNGLITIVETKLWRNPEARREVVGQILDYAKEVARWSYSDLDRLCKQKTGKSLYQLVKESGTHPNEFAEEEFVDQTSRALREGRFLLLIVGDGIREDVERMTEYLQAAPQLLFSLHLVELQFYQLPDGARLVVPQLIACTKEIPRAVVHVRMAEITGVILEVDLPPKPKTATTTSSRNRISEAEFLSQLEENLPNQVPFVQSLLAEVASNDQLFIDWQTSSFVIKTRDPAQPRNLFSLLNVSVDGKVYLWAIRDQFERAGIPTAFADKYVEETAKIVGTQVLNGNWSPSVSLATFAAHYDMVRAEMDALLVQIRGLHIAQNEPVN